MSSQCPAVAAAACTSVAYSVWAPEATNCTPTQISRKPLSRVITSMPVLPSRVVTVRALRSSRNSTRQTPSMAPRTAR